jgi:hypothetical protein
MVIHGSSSGSLSILFVFFFFFFFFFSLNRGIVFLLKKFWVIFFLLQFPGSLFFFFVGGRGETLLQLKVWEEHCKLLVSLRGGICIFILFFTYPNGTLVSSFSLL